MLRVHSGCGPTSPTQTTTMLTLPYSGGSSQEHMGVMVSTEELVLAPHSISTYNELDDANGNQ
jgi:hypothetical protein